MSLNRPLVAVRILIFKDEKVLLGERVNTHKQGDWGPTWGPPGGHLEFGENFEDCAIREAKEEIGIDIVNPHFFDVTNDFYEPDKKHHVTIFMKCNFPCGQIIENMEPKKISQWEWFDWGHLPENVFLAMKNLKKTL
jgi:8-oxo-dGTP diphosphatase